MLGTLNAQQDSPPFTSEACGCRRGRPHLQLGFARLCLCHSALTVFLAYRHSIKRACSTTPEPTSENLPENLLATPHHIANNLFAIIAMEVNRGVTQVAGGPHSSDIQPIAPPLLPSNKTLYHSSHTLPSDITQIA